LFGRWIRNFDFDEICSLIDINLKVETLTLSLLQKYYERFPTKIVVVSDSDKSWITKEFKP
jgi:hypothetical protein